jgi:DNA polymerase I
MKKLFLLDAVNFLFRSYHAIPPMIGEEGQSTHALFGFIRTLLKIQSSFAPEYLVAVFDGPNNKKARTALYEGYKNHRVSMPQDLLLQLEEAVTFCKLAGIATLMIPEVEADDAIGSIVQWAESQSMESFIFTSDKDLCQLVSPSTCIVHAHKDNLIVDKEKVFELFGVHPHQIVDYLALIGDASDNIPGVDGIGPKTASSLLQEFATLENILEHASAIKGKKGELLCKGKEKALLSKALALLQMDVLIPQDLSFYTLAPMQRDKLSEFCLKHRFLSLTKDLGLSTELLKPQPSLQKTHYKTVGSKEELEKLLALLQKQNSICLDTETTALQPREASLVGIGLGYEPFNAWYIPLNGALSREEVFSFLQSLFATAHLRFFGHNIKYDLHALMNEGLSTPLLDFDTILASYLLSPNAQRHNLDELSLTHFSHAKVPIEELIGKGKNQISMKDVPIEKIAYYCCEDVDYTIRLKELFVKQLEEKNLLSVLQNIELPLVPVLLMMERRGLFLDVCAIREVSSILATKIAALEEKIYELAGESFNINSPKQLSFLLYEKMKLKPPKKTQTGFSTSAETLESLADKSPIIPFVLEYRQVEKLRSTYTDTLESCISPTTGRIHCTFSQSTAATGRLSCQNPNLQNIPIRSEIGKKIRSSFRPKEEGWSFVSADYSQIELRLLAHLSEDPILMHAFEAGEDVHAYTASLIFNVRLQDVTSQMRRQAKAVNFGILYGQQAFGLSQGLSIGYAEAAHFIESYFDRYKKVKEYLECCKETARKTGVVTTLTGRQRQIPEILSSNPQIRAAAERLAINTPLQGTAADLIKLAMIRIDQAFPCKNSFPLLQIHDELLFECPDCEIDALSSFVKKQMEQVFTLKVPLIVDISVGKNWGDC